jgi:hypothetical protein
MGRYRSAIRWLSFVAFLVFAGPIVASVLGEFFIELAREKGLYANPSQRLDAAMTAFADFVTQVWFIALATFFAGLTLGAWLDWFMRRTPKDEQPLAEHGTYEGAHNDLMLFVVNHLLPTCDAHDRH